MFFVRFYYLSLVSAALIYLPQKSIKFKYSFNKSEKIVEEIGRIWEWRPVDSTLESWKLSNDVSLSSVHFAISDQLPLIWLITEMNLSYRIVRTLLSNVYKVELTFIDRLCILIIIFLYPAIPWKQKKNILGEHIQQGYLPYLLFYSFTDTILVYLYKHVLNLY